MPKISPERLTQEWEYLLTSQTETDRQRVQTLASLHQEALATYFYDHMLADPTASQFLSTIRCRIGCTVRCSAGWKACSQRKPWMPWRH